VEEHIKQKEKNQETGRKKQKAAHTRDYAASEAHPSYAFPLATLRCRDACVEMLDPGGVSHADDPKKKVDCMTPHRCTIEHEYNNGAAGWRPNRWFRGGER
jgi:hypothetical protein